MRSVRQVLRLRRSQLPGGTRTHPLCVGRGSAAAQSRRQHGGARALSTTARVAWRPAVAPQMDQPVQVPVLSNRCCPRSWTRWTRKACTSGADRAALERGRVPLASRPGLNTQTVCRCSLCPRATAERHREKWQRGTDRTGPWSNTSAQGRGRNHTPARCSQTVWVNGAGDLGRVLTTGEERERPLLPDTRNGMAGMEERQWWFGPTAAPWPLPRPGITAAGARIRPAHARSVAGSPPQRWHDRRCLGTDLWGPAAAADTAQQLSGPTPAHAATDTLTDTATETTAGAGPTPPPPSCAVPQR